MGAEHILESKTLDIWFRLTVLVTDDGKVSLKTLEYADDGKGEYYYEAYSDDVIQLGDTVWGYGSNNKLYELTVSKDASGTLSLTASNEGYYVVDSDRSYKVSLTVSEDLTQIETVHVIVDTAYTPTVYHVQSQTLSEDKTTATVTTDNGKFVIKISASESGVKFQLEVTHTDYDYTDELYDSDYDYAVTVKYHVDEEGNAKATGIEKIVMNNEDETVLEIDSVTVGADGVFTVNLKDKRVAKITVVSGSWSDSVTIEWVEA